MQPIPSDILTQFEAVLKRRSVPLSRHADYRKWLRYYLDFRSKYPLPDSRPEQVRLFIQKLWEKKQTPVQQKQAAHALSLYFESLQKIDNKTTPPAQINTEKAVMATTPSPLAASRSLVVSTAESLRPLIRGNLPNCPVVVIINGGAWRNQYHLTGTRLSAVLLQRSRRGIIPEKRSRHMRIGAASFRAT